MQYRLRRDRKGEVGERKRERKKERKKERRKERRKRRKQMKNLSKRRNGKLISLKLVQNPVWYVQEINRTPKMPLTL